MFTWFKSLFFKNAEGAIANVELEERIIILENQVSEISHVIQKQSALTTIIAGIQCDIITVINEKPPARKITSNDIEEALMNFPIDDDDFIN